MTLEDTIKLMTSDNPEDNLRAEYYQLNIRIQWLRWILAKELTRNKVFEDQLEGMLKYRDALERRMAFSKITY